MAEEQTEVGEMDPEAHPWAFRLLKYFGLLHHPVDVDDSPDGEPKDRDWLRTLLDVPSDQKQKAMIYDEMDRHGLIGSYLDILGEETTQPDPKRGKTVWVETTAKHIADAAAVCLDRTAMEDRIFDITRNMCKYGNDFERLYYRAVDGVQGWNQREYHSTHPVIDTRGRLQGYREDGVQYVTAHAVGAAVPNAVKRNESFPWDYIHFRMRGRNTHKNGKGVSELDRCFRSWRMLTMSEDAMFMYRLHRAPDRNLIIMDTGDLTDAQAMAAVQRWRKQYRKFEAVDPANNQYKTVFNPLTGHEDIWLPTRAGQETRVETLSGSGNIGEMHDIDHLRNMLFGAMRVPPAYMGFAGEINAKATLLQQDVRFARTAKRVRRAQVFAIRQLLDIHLTLVGGKDETTKKLYQLDDKKNAYVVQMPEVSYLDEYERLELIQLRTQIVTAMTSMFTEMRVDARVAAIYILLDWMKLPEELVLKLVSKMESAVAAAPPGEGPEGADAPGFESMTPKQRRAVVDSIRRTTSTGTGIYDLTDRERTTVTMLIQESAGLRESVHRMGLYFADDGGFGSGSLMERAAAQIDPAMKWIDVGKLEGAGDGTTDVQSN